MKVRGYVYFAIAFVVFVFVVYFVWFYFFIGVKISKDPADWGQFGSYFGGILGPLLSFLSIALLIKSLMLQSEANANLKDELRNSERIEKLRSFEVLFFSLIGSQRTLFDMFKINALKGGVIGELAGAKAVMEIEDTIQVIRNRGGSDKEITEYLERIDENDQIFGLFRAFYIMVMIITDKLSDVEGFSFEDRAAHFKALINLTDFAQLRLVMMCVQFLDYTSAEYLRSSLEFKNVAAELGLSYKLY
ncbi:hypothetical protein [Niveibacterium terrae]|uniref:hypothetical protein n=1 Tax=Niveibacterium terrae TaxID=3373598 RepID=UPI003A8FE260